MMLLSRFSLVLLLTSTVVACVATPSPAPQPTQTDTPSQSPTITQTLSPGMQTLVAKWATEGPIPTSTRRPAASPTHTDTPPDPTSIPIDLKAAAVVYEVGLGDGGISFYEFMRTAYTEPDLVVYVDGQVIARQNEWYVQRQAPPSEVCALIRNIRRAIEDQGERYLDIPLPEFGFGNGEPFVDVLISGQPFLSASMSIREPPYMTDSALRPFEIAQNYMSSHSYQPYTSDSVLIWLDEVTRSNRPTQADQFYLDWPEAGYGYARIIEALGTVPTGPIIVDAESLGLPDETTMFPTTSVFSEDGRDFLLMTRPALPHESTEQIATYQFGPGHPAPLESLSFECAP